ncbi:MAG: hypothetical protein M3Y45_08530, partial [Actinomycetota bacterium]|nr:hypothetical protein [Actinomycetota bacterium]
MRVTRIFGAGLLVLAGAAGSVLLWFRLSPWPGSMLIRSAFGKGAKATSEKLAARVPDDVTGQWGIRYDPDDPGALLDIFRPELPGGLAAGMPVIVWI